MTPAAMGMRLVYIGATAELAPAASLRALAGSGAVFVPAGLEAPLRELIAAAMEGVGEPGPASLAGAPSPVTAPPASVEDRLVEATPADLDLVFERLPAVVCGAGEDGPALARAGLERARHADVAVATVPVEPQFSDRLAGDQLVKSYTRKSLSVTAAKVKGPLTSAQTLDTLDAYLARLV